MLFYTLKAKMVGGWVNVGYGKFRNDCVKRIPLLDIGKEWGENVSDRQVRQTEHTDPLREWEWFFFRYKERKIFDAANVI